MLGRRLLARPRSKGKYHPPRLFDISTFIGERRMNRNKLAALIAAIALTLLSVGCGDTSNNANTTNANRTGTNANANK